MTALKRRFKKKITTIGGKGDEEVKAEEESKRINEEAQRLAKEAAEWLRTEEAKRKLDEELQTQEAERIKLTQQSAFETAAEQTQEVETPEV